MEKDKRFEVIEDVGYNGYDEVLWVLVCREDGEDGGYLEHGHDHGGHAFPITRKDLLGLLADINRALYAS